MKHLMVPAALCAALLSACSGGPALGDYGAREAAETPKPRYTALTADADFCRAVARSDAAGNSYDATTRSRMYASSLRQCVVVYAVNDTGLRVADLGGGTLSY